MILYIYVYIYVYTYMKLTYFCIHTHLYRCRYSYMAIDLKVLARSLNCESMCMLCWKPSHFFFELAFFYSRKFRDSWIL